MGEGERLEGGRASAHRYSKQIKSDFILRGRVHWAWAGVWSQCQLEDLYASTQSISRLNEAMEKQAGQHINRKQHPENTDLIRQYKQMNDF